MLKLCRFAKVRVFFLVLVYDINFDLFEFSAAILEKDLFDITLKYFVSFALEARLLTCYYG